MTTTIREETAADADAVQKIHAAFQVVKLSAYESWMTGTLVYAEPFWALDCVGLRDAHA